MDGARLLSADDLAKRLGVSMRSIRGWDASGRIPEPIRVGRLVRWPSDEIDDWIAARCPRRDEWAIDKSTK